MITPWHIWGAFLLELAFGNSKWLPRPENAVLRAVRFIEHLVVTEHPLFKNGVLKIGEKWAGVVLSLAVVLLTGGTGALLIFLSHHLHSKIELAVLLYLAYTTLTIRSFGDRAYEVFQWLQKKNLSFAEKELSLMTGRNKQGLPESEIIRVAVLTISENSVHGVVAPLLYLSLGGVPLAMAYQAVNTLYFSLGQKDLRNQRWGLGTVQLYDIVNCIPARITGVLMAIGATFLFGTGSKAFMILLRNCLQHHNTDVEIQDVVLAGAIGMTLRTPSADVDVLPMFPLREDQADSVQLHYIMDAVKLMCAVACIMLIVCMMI